MRDLVGSILFLSLKQKVDMGEVLNFHRLRYLISFDRSMKKKTLTQSKAITGTGARYCIY